MATQYNFSFNLNLNNIHWRTNMMHSYQMLRPINI